MLNIKRVRENPEEVREGLRKRSGEYDIDSVLQIDDQRRALLAEVEEKKAEKNRVSKEIPLKKKKGEDVSEIFESMRKLSDEIKGYDERLREIDEKMRDALLNIPNIPHPSVPVGKDDAENVELRKFGTPTSFDFEPKAHWDLGTDLGLLDFDRGAKLSGARFTVMTGKGARLERAIYNFMLDLHTIDQSYVEILPPFMVNRKAITRYVLLFGLGERSSNLVPAGL